MKQAAFQNCQRIEDDRSVERCCTSLLRKRRRPEVASDVISSAEDKDHNVYQYWLNFMVIPFTVFAQSTFVMDGWTQKRETSRVYGKYQIAYQWQSIMDCNIIIVMIINHQVIFTEMKHYPLKSVGCHHRHEHHFQLLAMSFSSSFQWSSSRVSVDVEKNSIQQ